MPAGIKANSDGSAAIQVGGTDVITLTSGGAATFVTSPTTVQAGTAAAPSITFSGDTDTGIFSPGANTLAFSTNGTEDARFDSNGRLLTGLTTAITSWGSGAAQQIQATASGAANPGFSTYAFSTSQSAAGMINLGHSRNATVGTITTTQSGDALGYLVFEGATSNNALTGGAYISVIQSGAAGASYIPAEMRFYTSDTTNGNVQRMTIDSNGFLAVNRATALDNYGVTFEKGNDKHLILNATTSGNGVYTTLTFANQSTARAYVYWFSTDSRFYVQNNTLGVYLALNGTAWTSNSDERLKTDLVPITDAVSKVATLRTVTGRFIEDEETTSRSFLIAQDVQAVFPQAVDADDPEKLGVRYTDTIPLLVAAIKEQQAMIDELKAKVAALEGA